MADAAGERPLRVDWLDAGALRDERPGRLGMTFLPGKHGASTRYPGRVYRRSLARDLDDLVVAGVRTLVLLVEDHELDRWGDPRIVERAAEARIRVLRRPMPDGSVPRSADEMTAILGEIAVARDSGDVAVACMGGVGRTGTVVACALVDAGWAPDAAILEVRDVRHPGAVETGEQIAFVASFAAGRGAADGTSSAG